MDNKFSVLMSVYKNENHDYLKESLYSVLNNTLIPDEIVLVEDGPLTKELYDVINFFKNEYIDKIKLVKLEKNMGLGTALSIGLKECSHEIVARMDTDDVCDKYRFEKQIEYIIKHKNIDVIGSNIIEYDEDMLKEKSIKIVPESHIEICAFLKKRNPFNHMSVMFRKSKVINCGSYEKMLYFEDYYLWCKMYKNGCHFHNLQDNLVKVRGGENMVKRRGGVKYISCIRNFLKSIKELGVISNYEYYYYLLLRIVVSLIPNKLRIIIYRKILRKKYN